MSFLVAPLPPENVYVRKEFLYDHQKGHGEFTPGIWISAKSTQYKALYFETLLTEYGALFDKLPISAFVWKTNHGELLPLDVLQLWDCFDYHLTVVEKPILSRCEFFGKDKRMHPGEYVFTIDNAHPDKSVLDINFSEHDPEHCYNPKSIRSDPETSLKFGRRKKLSAAVTYTNCNKSTL